MMKDIQDLKQDIETLVAVKRDRSTDDSYYIRFSVEHDVRVDRNTRDTIADMLITNKRKLLSQLEKEFKKL